MKFETQNLFFISDLHVGHANVILFDNRPFKDVNEMNETLIRNWNSVVTDEDTVFYLGDLSMRCHPKTIKWFVEQLAGKIHFFMGNHDRYHTIKTLNRFEKIWGDNDVIGAGMISVKDNDANNNYQNIVISHYPILSWNKAHSGSWHIHGHCHHTLAKNPEYDWFYKRSVIDVSCNGIDYTPMSYNDVKKIIQNKKLNA